MPTTSKTCPIHNKFQCEAITSDVSQHQIQIFKCWKCITAEKINTQSLHVIQDIIEAADEKTVLEKWPPLNDQENILQKVQKIFNQTDPKYPKKEICSKIDTFFEDLERKIKEYIENQKSQMLYLAQVYCDTNITVRQIYSEIASLDTFKNLVQNINDEYSEQRLIEFIQQKHAAINYNTDKLSLAVKQHEELNCLFDFERPNDIQQRILESIKQINFFVLDNDDDIQDYQSTITPTSQFSSTFEEKLVDEQHPHIDLIMKLVSNKFNFCSDMFLRELRQKLCKLKTYFSKISIENAFIQGRQPLTFENYTNAQLEEFSQIGQLISSSNNQNSFDSSCNPINSPIASTRAQTQSSPSLVQNLSKLLRMSQINELLKTQNERNMKLSFVKTEFKDSHFASVVGVDDQRNAVFKQVSQGYSIAYLNVPIMNELIYVMRIRIESKNNNYHFFCGLVPTQIKDIQYMHQQDVIFTQKDDRTGSVKTKGNHLHANGVRQKVKEIEIHFCIAQKVFVCSDYPNYENINTIPQERFRSLNTKEAYVFAFELYHPGDRYIVTHLQIADQFPEIQEVK